MIHLEDVPFPPHTYWNKLDATEPVQGNHAIHLLLWGFFISTVMEIKSIKCVFLEARKACYNLPLWHRSLFSPQG